ncbi:hypothetical protein F750_4938 [Streptomyces sp. PAMC 26508]|nr:hypothetical protein F750_4938 [Streptomyces sp. PAMC 26508]
MGALSVTLDGSVGPPRAATARDRRGCRRRGRSGAARPPAPRALHGVRPPSATSWVTPVPEAAPAPLVPVAPWARCASFVPICHGRYG